MQGVFGKNGLVLALDFIAQLVCNFWGSGGRGSGFGHRRCGSWCKQIVCCAFARLLLGFGQPAFEAQFGKAGHQVCPCGGFWAQIGHVIGQFLAEIHVGFDGDELFGQRQMV